MKGECPNVPYVLATPKPTSSPIGHHKLQIRYIDLRSWGSNTLRYLDENDDARNKHTIILHASHTKHNRSHSVRFSQ